MVTVLLFRRHLGSQLSEMRNVIERMMEADFVDFAVANLNITTKRSDEVYEEVRIKYRIPASLLLLGNCLTNLN